LSISGPFTDNEDYVIVADFDQQRVYQLKPDSGEVRGMLLSPCQPMSVVFDASINGMYLSCDDHPNSQRHQFVILKKLFNNRISQIIYLGTSGVFDIVSGMLLTVTSTTN